MELGASAKILSYYYDNTDCESTIYELSIKEFHNSLTHLIRLIKTRLIAGFSLLHTPEAVVARLLG